MGGAGPAAQLPEQVKLPGSRRGTASICLALCACLFPIAAAAERLHIVIPAAAGGGLDGTARAAGRALTAMELAGTVSFENIAGAGGGRGLSVFVENTARFREALIVNSTPLILRRLQNLYPLSFRDLTPIVGLVADYGIFVVRNEEPADSWLSVVTRLRENPRAVIMGGGSARGSLDHIVAALALDAAGVDARRVRYLPYDGGGKAMLALLGDEIELLSTGLGETLPFIRAGQVRVLAITAPERVKAIEDVPTLTELGCPVRFANWRGLFASPAVDEDVRVSHIQQFRTLTASDTWSGTLEQYGWEPLNLFGEDFTRYLEQQESLLRETMAKLGFTR